MIQVYASTNANLMTKKTSSVYKQLRIVMNAVLTHDVKLLVKELNPVTGFISTGFGNGREWRHIEGEI